MRAAEAGLLLVLLAASVRGQFHAGLEPGATLRPAGFGAALPITVTRQWPAGWTPEPFDDALFAPLCGELLAAAVEPLPGGGFREVRRYAVRAVGIGTVDLPPLLVRWRGPDGSMEVRTVEPPEVRVASALPSPPGAVEWAVELREPRRPARWPWWLGVALAAGAAVGLGFRRRTPGAAAAAYMAPPARDATLAALAALELPSAEPAAIDAFYLALAAIVRDHAARRFCLRAEVRTSEELVHDVPLGRDELAGCLQACDRVKFGAMRPDGTAHAAAHGAAVAFANAGGEPGTEAAP